jgi:nitrogen fixation protein FixH
MSLTLPEPRRSAWIPWVFVGGMLIVVAVNAVLVYAALTTFAGVTTPKAYERGRLYNEVLAEAARQDALGWRLTAELREGVLRVHAADREGLPLGGRLEGVLVRPLEGNQVALDFAAAAPGLWIAAAPALRPGQWEARLRLRRGEERSDAAIRLIAP